MPITRIPERYRRGLARIRSLAPEQILQLRDALAKCPATQKPSQFSSKAAAELKNWKKEDIEDIIRSLYSLTLYCEDASVPVEKAAQETVRAMRTSGREDLKLADGEEEEFKDKLSNLLSVDSLSVSSKATRLRTDYPKTFCTVRILTDIRPVFAETVGDPTGAVISHTLKIDYHEDENLKEFYVALDAEDLRKLKSVLERAESKATALKSILAKSGVTDLDLL